MLIKIKDILHKFICHKEYSYEELLVLDVMDNINQMINRNPFEYLVLFFSIGNPEDLKKITYVFYNKKLFVDDQDKITGKEKSLNFNKYCYVFNGKPKNFIELEKYEFLFQNMHEIKNSFDVAVEAKKKQYKIKG